MPPPAGERTLMFSSFDRRARLDADGRPVDWFANDDEGQFLRRDADGWYVMAELSGPGALTRLWAGRPRGDIRFVLDGDVALEAKLDELLAGRVAPLAAPLVCGGLNCYFPLGFNQSCRVLGTDATARYQLNFVQFPNTLTVQRFTPQLDDAAQAALTEVQRALDKGLTEKQLAGPRKTMPVAVQKDVSPGDALSETLDGSGTVWAFYLALTDRTAPRGAYALHRCLLRMYVDGEESPAVEAPLTDFFGSGFDRVPFCSLAAGTDKPLTLPIPDPVTGEDRIGSSFFYCFFPMPYRDGLRIEIHNFNDSKKPIGLLIYLRTETKPPPEDALRFHARFHKQDPCTAPEFPVLDVQGRGRLVGCVLSIDCPRIAWWGDGDEKIWVDGAKFPTCFGTGTADYLGHARGRPTFIAPFVGLTRAAPYGKNSGYRWLVPDAVNFQTALRFTLENLPEGGINDTYYGTVVYWYAAPGSTDSFQPLTAADLRPPGLRIPGAVEIEDHVLTPDWGNRVSEEHYPGVEFTGGQAANFTSNGPFQINLPSDRAGPARLYVRVNPSRPFEAITVRDAAGTELAPIKYDRNAANGIYPVGPINLAAGDNHLTVEFSRPTQLDCWIVEPEPQSGPP